VPRLIRGQGRRRARFAERAANCDAATNGIVVPTGGRDPGQTYSDVVALLEPGVGKRPLAGSGSL
jgi:hypothetical protein